jgi:hypothetical protein
LFVFVRNWVSEDLFCGDLILELDVSACASN